MYANSWCLHASLLSLPGTVVVKDITQKKKTEHTAKQGWRSISHSSTVCTTLVALSGKRGSDTYSLLTSRITYT